ncbi:hypothetical protein JZ751_023324 [Albula glossodonta]|uniref:Uncharacterized protein n=1 Tax=Albula glossodonta TaxID=121402 RepID=A0A8T2NQ44_9TELE|nr:hypothetical protein JZ751_023324 [Albula glossodonta]
MWVAPPVLLLGCQFLAFRFLPSLFPAIHRPSLTNHRRDLLIGKRSDVNVKSTMCSLALFPSPLGDGQVTLYESNNELVTGSSLDSYQKQEWDHQSLIFPRDALKSHSHLESSSKAAFLDHRDTLWMRSAGAWRDSGLNGLLEEIVNSGNGEGEYHKKPDSERSVQF